MIGPDHIETRSALSDYLQIGGFLFQMLTVAQAGGMSEKRAEEIYNEIMSTYSNMRGEVFWCFRDELIHLLVMPDDKWGNAQQMDRGGWSRN